MPILDTCRRPYDDVWLDYQHEIALRHTQAKKDQIDHVNAVDRVPLRHIIAFIYPITATIRPFLSAKGHDRDDVDRRYQAWLKAVTLQVALWSRPYAREGDWSRDRAIAVEHAPAARLLARLEREAAVGWRLEFCRCFLVLGLWWPVV
ncbi:protoglobin domain-containing protein [Saccharopolyspora sp. ASAGF58]|uniref:protoglobin domain-containing protein n=1 Tax=Saccharopolyspora sp. ASAGF58 TaxID=2719023 RepID=UPI001FF0C055|nr:protoglobin domain-containing protein [Saccharopolyspora sp. ASAGF58]